MRDEYLINIFVTVPILKFRKTKVLVKYNFGYFTPLRPKNVLTLLLPRVKNYVAPHFWLSYCMSYTIPLKVKPFLDFVFTTTQLKQKYISKFSGLVRSEWRLDRPGFNFELFTFFFEYIYLKQDHINFDLKYLLKTRSHKMQGSLPKSQREQNVKIILFKKLKTIPTILALQKLIVI